MNDPVVFSAEWFERHQGKLLWLLNHWLTKRWFRWVLCIRKCDIGYALPVVELFPHAYTVALGCNEFATDFRTHRKFAKRLYHAFTPLWLTMHAWDFAIADWLVPKTSFGFSTFTFYPDASTGATTVDGSSGRTAVDETWATIIAGAGNSHDDTSSSITVQARASAVSNQFQILHRAILTFNTSPLKQVVSAVLSLAGLSKQIGLGAFDLHVAGSTPASNNILANADFGQCQTTSFGSVTSASLSTNGSYNDVSLNASGTANIVRGISKFSVQVSWDILASFTGVWSSGLSSLWTFQSADTAGTSSDPKLVVVYLDASFGADVQVNYRNRLRPRMFGPGMAR